MHASQFQELLEKYSRGACTPEEEQLIHDWYDNVGQDGQREPGMEERANIEERLWSALKPGREDKKRKWVPLKRAAMITIPLLLIGFAGYYIRQQSVRPIQTSFQKNALIPKRLVSRFYNDGKTERLVSLEDGSRILLKPASELIVRSNFNKEKREVQLKGEAFFHVKRDPARPFFVYANEVVTRVLGTSFRVSAYENDRDVTVAVKSGKVSVYASGADASGRSSKARHEVILTPNQQMVYHRVDDIISKELVEKPEVILPNSNLFRMQFENAEVSQIFKVLEENYGVEIRFDKNLLKNCRLTTSMSDEGLYERIEVICKAIGASYWCDDAVITIKSNGC
ncbi:MAG TPA: FecR domain-containing protein [Chryseosolibacter sp.]